MLNLLSTIHDDEAVERARREAKLDPRPLRRFRYGFYQLRRHVDELLEELPAGAGTEFARRLRFHVLELESQASTADGATKLVYRTSAGWRLETVILRAPFSRRTSLCLSSQVGCAAKCVFCATGQMAQVRNLAASEIVDQLVQANLLLRGEQRRVENVVFMGMGEPLHNEEQVMRAAELIFSNHHFNLSPRRTVLSTVGVPDGMLRWARRFRRSPLALSLHAARQELREQLIPLAARYPLPMLRQTLEHVAAIQRAPMMIEYLLLDGINTELADADLLANFVRGLPALINLIPLNPVTHAPHLRSPERAAGSAFAARLRETGCTVTFRRSLGGEVQAACGQLVQSRTAPPSSNFTA